MLQQLIQAATTAWQQRHAHHVPQLQQQQLGIRGLQESSAAGACKRAVIAV
jgi:hypothetical protein